MKTTIRIEKIEVTISGLSKETVRSSFVGLDKELSIQAGQILWHNKNSLYHSSQINAGNLKVNSNIHPAHLRQIVARQVVKSLVQESL
jgi:hypothetical protein